MYIYIYIDIYIYIYICDNHIYIYIYMSSTQLYINHVSIILLYQPATLEGRDTDLTGHQGGGDRDLEPQMAIE